MSRSSSRSRSRDQRGSYVRDRDRGRGRDRRDSPSYELDSADRSRRDDTSRRGQSDDPFAGLEEGFRGGRAPSPRRGDRDGYGGGRDRDRDRNGRGYDRGRGGDSGDYDRRNGDRDLNRRDNDGFAVPRARSPGDTGRGKGKFWDRDGKGKGKDRDFRKGGDKGKGKGDVDTDFLEQRNQKRAHSTFQYDWIWRRSESIERGRPVKKAAVEGQEALPDFAAKAPPGKGKSPEPKDGSGSGSDSNSDSSSDKKKKKSSKSKKAKKSKKKSKKKKKKVVVSSSSESDKSASESDDGDLFALPVYEDLLLPDGQQPVWLELKVAHADTAGSGAIELSDESDDDDIGPKPLPGSMGDGNLNQKSGSYGGRLLPGEGDAMAKFVQEGKRIPRRGEIGIRAEEIEELENVGFVMSGSRHAKMNAVRLRKENQVYSAEEQRALAMFSFEEKANREQQLIMDLRDMIQNTQEKLEDKFVDGGVAKKFT
jgi:hypothetical protein